MKKQTKIPIKSLKVHKNTHTRLMKLVGFDGCKSIDDVINLLIDLKENKGKKAGKVRKSS